MPYKKLQRVTEPILEARQYLSKATVYIDRALKALREVKAFEDGKPALKGASPKPKKARKVAGTG